LLTPWVMRLLVANVIMFLLQGPMAALAEQMVFYPPWLLQRPWTLVTYMFLHGSTMHLLFNMIAIFFFGPRVEQRLGSRRFIIMYFVAGIVGALASFALSRNAAIVGASAGVFGVMFAFARFWPRERILIWGIIPVEAWLLVLLTTVFALFSGFTGMSRGIAHFAHLGGYLGAWLYLIFLDRTAGSRTFRKKASSADRKTEKALAAKWKEVNVEGMHELTKEEVNRILDKINREGIKSLTDQEKLFLSNFVPPDDRKPA
jgi:membrane associated rhomboid family serine protease